MVDYFAIGLTHGLLALAAGRLMMRADLDADPGSDGEAPPRPGARKPAARRDA